jgi:hypothetical protein
MKKTVLVILVIFAAATTVGYADIIWGSAVDNDGYNASKLFKYDTVTGTATKTMVMVGTSYGISYISDVAYHSNGNLYATAWGYYTGTPANGDGNWYDRYDTLVRFDPTAANWSQWTGAWDMNPSDSGHLRGDPTSDDVIGTTGDYSLDALEFIDNKLIAVEGGGIENGNIVEIQLDSQGAYAGRTDLSSIGNGYAFDGDLAQHPVTGDVYGTFWNIANEKVEIRTVDIYTGASSLICETPVDFAGGITFDSSGNLWAGRDQVYHSNNTDDLGLYVIDLTDGSWNEQVSHSYMYSVLNNLSTDGVTIWGGAVDGISGLTTPEPGTMILLGLGGVLLRRRK